MSATVLGAIDWDVEQEKERAHRDYTIIWLVKTDDPNDGPNVVGNAPDLPKIGSYWQFGNDVDPWAFCSPEITVKPVIAREPNLYWTVEQLFTTRPFFRCQDFSYENPLFEPMRISGSFNPEKMEQYYGRNGYPYVNSSGEPLTGKATEFDVSKPTVRIGFNIPDLPLGFITSMMHHLNDDFLWGCSPLCVKFSNCTFQRLVYGSCFYYYSVDLDFDIDFNTFDRKVYDSGTMYLPEGKDANDVRNYEVYLDKKGNNPKRVFLNGNGGVLSDLQQPVALTLAHYPVGNLLSLGIPSSL